MGTDGEWATGVALVGPVAGYIISFFGGTRGHLMSAFLNSISLSSFFFTVNLHSVCCFTGMRRGRWLLPCLVSFFLALQFGFGICKGMRSNSV